jgi:hypothetical protein
MASVSMSINLNAPADEVWKLIGGFNALPDWHPAIVKSDLEEDGKVRRLELDGGAVIMERLEAHDDAARMYRYVITESPLPLEGYVAVIRVGEGEGGQGTRVEWSSEFTPSGVPEADAVELTRGIYQAGFDALATRFGGK